MPRSSRQQDVTQANQKQNTIDIARLTQQILDITISGSGSYVHDQGIPSLTWTINHGLDKFPSVTVVDSAGTVVIGDITFNSSNLLTITFNASFSGKAFIN